MWEDDIEAIHQEFELVLTEGILANHLVAEEGNAHPIHVDNKANRELLNLVE